MKHFQGDMTDRDADKRLAAVAAVKEVCDDMLVGLGTGSTAAHAIAALADRRLAIEAVAGGQDVGSPALLNHYQRMRRPDNVAMLAMTDGLDRLFSSDNPTLRLARDVGIAAVHRMPRLKRLFMRRAMGLA